MKRERIGQQTAQCYSYHTGYKGSQAALWELCSGPELAWSQGRNPEAQLLEWWEEEEPAQRTGLLGVCRNCNLLVGVIMRSFLITVIPMTVAFGMSYMTTEEVLVALNKTQHDLQIV